MGKITPQPRKSFYTGGERTEIPGYWGEKSRGETEPGGKIASTRQKKTGEKGESMVGGTKKGDMRAICTEKNEEKIRNT